MSETFQYVRRRKHIAAHNPFSVKYNLNEGMYVPEDGLFLGAWIEREEDGSLWKIVAKHKTSGNSWIRMGDGNAAYHHTEYVSKTWRTARFQPEIRKARIEKYIESDWQAIAAIVGPNFTWIQHSNT